MPKAFRAFLNENTDRYVRAMFSLVARPLKAGLRQGTLDLDELSIAFDVPKAQVRHVITKLAPVMRPKGLDLSYEKGEHINSGRGPNPFGSRYNAMARDIAPVVRWRYIPKNER
jgi:hypothetical protein